MSKTRYKIEFFILSIIWSFSYIFMRQSVPYIGPVGVVFFRTFLGGLFLLPVVAQKKLLPELWANKGKLLLFGLFNCGVPFSLISYAVITLPVSLSSLLNSLTPMFTAVFAFFFFAERLTIHKILGVVLGVLGVLVLMLGRGGFVTKDGPQVIISVLASITACISYAVGSLATKTYGKGINSLVLASGSQFFNGLLFLVPALFFLPDLRTVPGLVWFDVFSLAFFCTGVAYILFYRIIANLGSLVATSVTFVVPFFTTLLGAILLSEPISVLFFLGGVLIIFGSLLTLGMVRRNSFRKLLIHRVKKKAASRGSA